MKAFICAALIAGVILSQAVPALSQEEAKPVSLDYSIQKARAIAASKIQQAQARSLAAEGGLSKETSVAQKEIQQAQLEIKESQLKIARSGKKIKAAEEKIIILNEYYIKGVEAYKVADYLGAIKYFQKIFEIDPGFEPAKLYLESSVIQQSIIEARTKTEKIKVEMADIIAEYDMRRDRVDSLAVKYFLEQAQRKCQLGDYKGAENLYGLCYKVYPYSKDKIEWFVKATYDLSELSEALDEQGKNIEDIATGKRERL
ncbi:MAG: hypothetical protein HQ558_04095 [Candidatus Omnitrophica bacterium]|nr:hypothetical protein [Candidatus Omnitrophota bacterium]